jgi:hypothetical protein
MAPRKGKVQQEQVQVSLGPQIREGEVVFGVAHIFASFNDTFVHVTDLSGRYVYFVFSTRLKDREIFKFERGAISIGERIW